MKTQFRIYRNNGAHDVLRWKENREVTDGLSEEEVFDLYKNQFLMEAKEITFSGVWFYRTQKRNTLVFTFYW